MTQYITVGIPTLGNPVIEKQGKYTLLKNMLIGKDFHWQKEVEALLPGEIVVKPGEEYPVINRLPIETYLQCVVGSEMNPNAPEEFIKAHAVISRSWAIGKILGCHSESEEGKINLQDKIVNWEDTCDHTGFDVCSDDHCQRYQGIQPIPDKVMEALKATEGEILLSPSGKLVDARFSKCCGGRTEVFSTCWQPHEEECLESFEDPWCDLSGMTESQREHLLRAVLKDYDLMNQGGYEWHTFINNKEITQNLLTKFKRNIGDILDLTVTRRGPSGRALELNLKGSEGELTLGKELMIRRLLAPTHLYSSWIELKRDSVNQDQWNIHGRGWGHGVGLCQIGAARMATEGYSYQDILSFYYPGAMISNGSFNFRKLKVIS